MYVWWCQPAEPASGLEVAERSSLKTAQNLCVAFISFANLSAPVEISQSGGQGERDWSVGELFSVNSCPSLRPLSVIPAFLGLPHLLGQWGSIPDKGWASAPSPTIFLSLLFQKDKEASRSCRIPNLCGRRSTSHFALFLPQIRRGREPEKFMGILAFFKWGLWGRAAF